MLTKKVLLITITFIVASLFVIQLNQAKDEHVQISKVNEIEITYKAISGMIRSQFTSVTNLGQKVYAGDGAGGISIWDYTNKKYTLNFTDNTRGITPQIQDNPVLQIEVSNKAVVGLTPSGLKSYQIGVSGQFTGKSAVFETKDNSFSEFALMDTGNGVSHFLTISKDNKQLCLHKLAKDLNNPNPIQQLACNKSNSNSYLDVKYSPLQSLIAVGDSKDLVIFQYSNDSFGYLMGLQQPKSDQKHFGAVFPPKSQDQNKQLLTVNGLYLNLIVYDEKTPTIKIIQSEKTADGLFAKGFSDQISVSPAPGDRTVLINGQSKGELYKITNKTQKISKINETKVTDGFTNFVLYNTDTFFIVKGDDLSVYQAKDPQSPNDDFFHLQNSYNAISSNHFNPVSGLASANNYFISASDGGKNNLKVWRVVNEKLTLLDTTTQVYSSIIKTTQMNLNTILLLPPLKSENLRQNAPTDTMHILVAGNQPFDLILFPLTTADKFPQFPLKTKDTHSNNVTVLLTNAKQSFIVSAGLDGAIKSWTLDSTRKQLTLVDTVISKDGNIAFGIIDSTGTKIIFGHNGNDKSSLVNITIWDYDETKHKITKNTSNVPGESHQSNLTSLLLTKNQKYLVSYSQSGELRLWRHQNFTMIDLLASLSLGIVNAKLSITDKGTLIVQNSQQFFEYLIDANGFVENGRVKKQYKAKPTCNMLISGNYMFSGDEDGSIRTYQLAN